MNTLNGCGIKRIALINDLSCLGKCSLSVSMPIISSYGIETVPLPTAILSTHTAGFDGYVLQDMTEQMKCFAEHWKTIGVEFDCIYTGFFCSIDQIRFACDFIKQFANKDTLVVVDPVLGDNGNLYNCFSDEYVVEMRKLCSLAEIITPNRTEASLLTGLPFESNDYELLSALPNKNVIITSTESGEEIGYIASFENEITSIKTKKQSIKLHGAGDVFTSALCSEIMSGSDYKSALQKAADFCDRCIRETMNKQPAHWYGLWFEDELKRRSL